jgi:hypothetical protein
MQWQGTFIVIIKQISRDNIRRHPKTHWTFYLSIDFSMLHYKKGYMIAM